MTADRTRLGPLALAGFAAAAALAAVALARAEEGEPVDAGPDDADVDGGLDDADADGEGDAEGDADVGDAIAERAAETRPELPDDEAWIFIDKSERRMEVNDGQGWREEFRVALGQTPVGDKRREGDGRTPEGEFYVCTRIANARFHRFLGVSYPGPEDAARGLRDRILQPIEVRAILRAFRNRTLPPWQTSLGGNIGIHGYGRRRDREAEHAAGRDWTDGCIAVTNEEIERVYDHVQLGTRLVIVP
jgi:lipoprotein-anchoring transpeptidase ErfK/SrfK